MEDLVSRLVTGSRESWDELLDRYSRLVYKVFCTKSFGFSREDIEELFNDFLLNLMKENFKKIRLFEGRNQCSFASYLKKIAINQAIDRRKRMIRTRMASIHMNLGPATGERGGELLDTIDSGFKGPQQLLMEEEERRQYLFVLYRLAPAKLLLVLLLAYHKYDREDLARRLKTTRQNIDVLYNRCKEQMKNELAKAGDQPPPTGEFSREILELQEQMALGDRDGLLDRCLQSLKVPEELLVGILFLNGAIVEPTPDRIAQVLGWEKPDLETRVEGILRVILLQGKNP